MAKTKGRGENIERKKHKGWRVFVTFASFFRVFSLNFMDTDRQVATR